MVKHLLNRLTGICLLLGCIGGAACTADLTPSASTYSDVDQLVRWSQRLPGSAGIYNEGLIGLPVVDNKVLFHSTLFTNEYQEDNRIHALDSTTGKLVWTFPSGFDSREPYYFEGKPYIHEDVLVTKMSAFEPYSYHDRILLLNVKSGIKQKLIHIPRSLSQFSCRDVTGDGQDAWFILEDNRNSYLYKLTLTTGDTTRILTLQSGTDGGRVEVTSRELTLTMFEGQRIICLGLLDKGEDGSGLQVIVVNADTGHFLLKKEVKQDLNFILNSVLIKGDQLFYTCGRFAGCIGIPDGQYCWQFDAGGSVDQIIPGLVVQDSIALVWGHSGYTGVDVRTGRKLYTKEMECVSVSGFSPWFFSVRSDGKVSIIQQNTGDEIRQLSVRSTINRAGFSYSCKPGISGNSLFLFGEYIAYCFDLDKITHK